MFSEQTVHPINSRLYLRKVGRRKCQPYLGTVGRRKCQPYLGIVGRPKCQPYLGTVGRRKCQPYLGIIGRPKCQPYLGIVGRPKCQPYLGTVGRPKCQPYLGIVGRQKCQPYLGIVGRQKCEQCLQCSAPHAHDVVLEEWPESWDKFCQRLGQAATSKHLTSYLCQSFLCYYGLQPADTWHLISVNPFFVTMGCNQQTLGCNQQTLDILSLSILSLLHGLQPANTWHLISVNPFFVTMGCNQQTLDILSLSILSLLLWAATNRHLTSYLCQSFLCYYGLQPADTWHLISVNPLLLWAAGSKHLTSYSIQKHKAVQEPKTRRGDSVWYMHYTVDPRREERVIVAVS